MKTSSRFSRNVYAISNKYDVTNISDTQPRKNMITMGKVDTSDLMMIITWAIDISFQSPILKWASWTHKAPYIVNVYYWYPLIDRCLIFCLICTSQTVFLLSSSTLVLIISIYRVLTFSTSFYPPASLVIKMRNIPDLDAILVVSCII